MHNGMIQVILHLVGYVRFETDTCGFPHAKRSVFGRFDPAGLKKSITTIKRWPTRVANCLAFNN
jgi:hypothetical protein